MTCDHLDTPRCPRAACMHPHGVCLLSAHRIDASFIEPGKVVAIKGRVEQRIPRTLQEAYGPGQHVLLDPEPINPALLALNTWRLYRRAGCGVRESFRNALRAYRRAN